MRMGIRSELNKLARILVDIPSTLDSVWMLDVKKSSAKIPDSVKEWIKIAVQDSVVRSRKTNKFPGVKEQTPAIKVWDRIDEHEGKIKYQLNRQNPIVVALKDCLGDKENNLLEMLLSQIECYLPKYSIINDNNDSLNIINTGDDSEEERIVDEIRDIIAMVDVDKQDEMFDTLFMMESYQKVQTKKEEIRRRIFGD